MTDYWLLAVYPEHAKKLILDPAKGIFVPLVVRLSCCLPYRGLLTALQVLSFATIIIGTVNYHVGNNVHAPPMVLYSLFWYVARLYITL